MPDPYRRVLRRFRRQHLRFPRGPEYPLIAQRCPSLLAQDRFLVHQAALHSHAIYVSPRKPSQELSSTFISERLPFVKALPHEQASTATRRTDPARLERPIGTGSRFIPCCTWEALFRAAEFFDVYSMMAVHNLRSRIRLLAGSRCENHNASTSNTPDVSVRVRLSRAHCREIPSQIHFKVSAWNTRGSAERHIPGLTQNADVTCGKTAGLEIANDFVDRGRTLKQTNRCFCHIASTNSILLHARC